MSDENPVKARSYLENRGVRDPYQAAVGCGRKIDCRLTVTDGSNDSLPDVGIGLETNQCCDWPILARAR